MNDAVFHAFDSRDALTQALTNYVAGCLSEAIKTRQSASLVVSGGSTPVAFFKALQMYDLPWEHVTITVADERWVLTEHDDSNEKLVRDHFLHEDAHYVSLAPISQQESLHDGAMRLQETLAQIPAPFDVVILGMGEDGHTASLFPNHPMLEQGLDMNHDALCLAIENSPKPPSQRVTLTANRLCHARHMIVHITGDTKRDVYEKALQSGDAGAYPIAGIVRQSAHPASVYWAA